MRLESGRFCPLIKEDCIQTKCAWFTQVRGIHPQTGEPVDEWACAMAWLPVLLIDNTQQTRQHGAAIESLRNESVKALIGVGAAMLKLEAPK